MNNEDPENTCAFCLQPFEHCHCDEVRQLEKDDELFSAVFTSAAEETPRPLNAAVDSGRRKKYPPCLLARPKK